MPLTSLPPPPFGRGAVDSSTPVPRRDQPVGRPPLPGPTAPRGGLVEIRGAQVLRDLEVLRAASTSRSRPAR